MRTSLCKGCGRKIGWIETVNGKAMPVDPKMILYWQNPQGIAAVVAPNGEVVKADLTGPDDAATGLGYTSHFATCPAAAGFRRR